MKQKLQEHKINFIKVLEDYLAGLEPLNFGERELKSAILYSLLSDDAKYIRSFLVLETAKMLGADAFAMKQMQKIAIAVEMVHTYSLIHDDLPCMDNSDYRRGLPSSHKQFGESTAVLTGNAINAMAFEVLAGLLPAELAVLIIAELARVSGFYGLLLGQVLDLNPKYKIEEFEVMNYHKTGKLLEFCVASPAMLLQNKSIQSLRSYGKSLGMAYQMKDDLLDEGEDGYSFLHLYKTKEALQIELENTVKECRLALHTFKNNQTLLDLPQFLIERSF